METRENNGNKALIESCELIDLLEMKGVSLRLWALSFVREQEIKDGEESDVVLWFGVKRRKNTHRAGLIFLVNKNLHKKACILRIFLIKCCSQSVSGIMGG